MGRRRKGGGRGRESGQPRKAPKLIKRLIWRIRAADPTPLDSSDKKPVPPFLQRRGQAPDTRQEAQGGEGRRGRGEEGIGWALVVGRGRARQGGGGGA